MDGDDRRQHPRFVLRAQAEVRFVNWTVFKLLYTVNISKGGMNLELGDEPAIGDKLRVKLVLPDGWPVDIDATVRHVSKLEPAVGQPHFHTRFQVGVEFENLDADRKALIEQTIRKRATHAP